MVPIGEQGEVQVKGYLTMQRYWNDPEKTAECLQDGWMKTGDLGRLDSEGYLSIVGRSKDLIIRGGENISPREIEDYFHKLIQVQDIQVVGCEDEVFGEEVVAWIIPDIEVTNTSELVKDLLAASQNKIAHYKLPKYIYFTDHFPLTISGKVKKNEIRAETNALLLAESPLLLKFAPHKNK